MHWEPQYRVGGDPSDDTKCIDTIAGQQRRAGPFGEGSCDSPFSLLESLFDFLRQSSEARPDFIVWTGDNTGHTLETQSPETNMDIERNMTTLFQRHFPATAVLPTLGNHEGFPPSQLDTENPSETTGPLADLWADWLGPDAATQFGAWGRYSKLIAPGVRVLALNSYCYDVNNIALRIFPPRDPCGQTAWLESQLESARRAAERVIILSHIAVVTGQAYAPFVASFATLMERYGDVVLWQLMGHTHREEFRLLRSSEGALTGAQLLTGSVTPISSNNPSLRVFIYDKASWQLVDAVTYWANLTLANEVGQITWEPLYSMQGAFPVKNLSPPELENLWMRFHTDEALWEQYVALSSRYWPGKAPCAGSCKREQLCTMGYNDAAQRQKCLASS